MQKPKTAGQKADPLKVGPAIPDVVIVPGISARHVVEPRHRAVQLHVVANCVSTVAEIANSPLKRSLIVLVHSIPRQVWNSSLVSGSMNRWQARVLMMSTPWSRMLQRPNPGTPQHIGGGAALGGEREVAPLLRLEVEHGGGTGHFE